MTCRQGGPDNFVLIIGAMKAGTTTLFSLMAEHPQICPSSPKEPDFFSDPTEWQRGFEFYRSLWAWQPLQHRVAMEGSTSYTKRPRYEGTAERIRQSPGRYRFIYVVRDPLERIESHRRHDVAWAKRSAESLSLTEEEIAFSSYAMQLDEYVECFGRDSILVVQFEQLKHDPVAVLKELCGFLGLDADVDFGDLSRVKNSPRILPPVRRRIIKSRPVQAVARRLPRDFRRFLRDSVAKPMDSSFGALSWAEQEKVRDSLRNDIDRFARIYGVDTALWKKWSARA